MAKVQIATTAGTTGPNSHSHKSPAQVDYTTVAANIATLVADGASPTQGHVNTLNTNWATLKAQIDSQANADVVLIVDNTNVTKNRLKEILNNFATRLTDGMVFLS